MNRILTTYKPNENAGFSLIELMIVIAIIGILVAVALPQFTDMTGDAKKAKAKTDVNTLAQAIVKFDTFEGIMCESLNELKGKYMNNIDALRDPWGQSYKYDPIYGIVFSRGPDGKHSSTKDKTWNDDIMVDVYPGLTLVRAEIEIDPDSDTDENTAYDRLYLTFNKAVTTIDTTLDLSQATAAVNDMNYKQTGKDQDALDGKLIRWYQGTRPQFHSAWSPFPDDMQVLVRHTDDPREIVLVFPPGYTEVLEATTYLNLTGGRKEQNQFFRSLDPTKGAVATGSPVRIDPYTGNGIEVDPEVAANVEAAKTGSRPAARLNQGETMEEN